MITLNLLPPIQKEKIKKMAIYSIAENLIASIFIILVAVAISFLIAENTLQFKFSQLLAEIASTSNELEKIDYEVKKINSEVKTVSAIQNDYHKWSDFLVNLNQLIVPGIQINNLDITLSDLEKKEEENNLKISGTAAKREALLAFEKNLKKSPLFSKINSPLSNILSKENIEFTFDVKFQ